MRFPVLTIIFLLVASQPLVAVEPTIVSFVGQTMGTSYSVKIFDPPDFQDDVRLAIDAELRAVNDQMSTYLKSSEISRFNNSESTDWFAVSPEFATVVDYAQQISKKTDGAFDITIHPLVNAWSFGADEKTNTVPTDETIARLLQSVGYEKLSVRLEPPALRKSVPELTIDLSAIAKGHGVDRVVELLNDMGAKNVFVEIGGEVRVSGNKNGQWWKVGIQVPDIGREQVMIAHSLSTGGQNDQAMATSGDYRNFFEVDGVRYSHTIDPRNGRPVEHELASVSVVGQTCMQCDAWATAINVLGPEQGSAIATAEKLDVLLVNRGDGEFERIGIGAMTAYADANPAAPPAPVRNGNPLAIMVITFVAFAVLLFAMAVGVMFGRRSIGGSCGGLANTTDGEGNVSCSLCSNPENACKELQQRMQQSSGQPVRQSS